MCSVIFPGTFVYTWSINVSEVSVTLVDWSIICFKCKESKVLVDDLLFELSNNKLKLRSPKIITP